MSETSNILPLNFYWKLKLSCYSLLFEIAVGRKAFQMKKRDRCDWTSWFNLIYFRVPLSFGSCQVWQPSSWSIIATFDFHLLSKFFYHGLLFEWMLILLPFSCKSQNSSHFFAIKQQQFGNWKCLIAVILHRCWFRFLN